MSQRTSSNPGELLPEPMKKTPSPRRQTTRSTSHLNKDSSASLASSSSRTNNEKCIQVIKPVAVRPPSSSDLNPNPYNLRSRSKLKSTSNGNPTTTTTTTTEVIPSFTEKLSLETPLNSSKPVPPLTRAAALKIGSTLIDEASMQTKNSSTKGTTTATHRSTTNSRKRKASDDDHRPYLDLLKMKQTQSTYSFDGNSPKKMTRRADQDSLPVDDDDSGCDEDSPGHSPVDFTDLPPGHVYHYEESNMSYDSGFSTGSSEVKHPTQPSSSSRSPGILTRSSSANKYPAAVDLDVNAIEDDLAF